MPQLPVINDDLMMARDLNLILTSSLRVVTIYVLG